VLKWLHTALTVCSQHFYLKGTQLWKVYRENV